MEKIAGKDLRPGMVLGADTYVANGQVLFPVGTVLDDEKINRLVYHSIELVEIAEESSGIRGGGALSHDSYFEGIRESSAFLDYEELFEKTRNEFRKECARIIEEDTPIALDRMLQMVETLLHAAEKSGGVLHVLHSMNGYDDESYAHCLNVSLLANQLATWAGYNRTEVEMAMLSGLFHDIGKTKIPESVLRKKGRLTEGERRLVQRHTVEGFQILQKQKVDMHIKNAVLLHHERMDGSGYPMGLKGPQIDLYARLIAIVDVYDAITSPRVYRAALCPYTAISLIEEEGINKYDSKLIHIFLEHVIDTYKDYPVRLSNGESARVVKIQKEGYARPLVKAGNRFYDLLEKKELKIVDIM